MSIAIFGKKDKCYNPFLWKRLGHSGLKYGYDEVGIGYQPYFKISNEFKTKKQLFSGNRIVDLVLTDLEPKTRNIEAYELKLKNYKEALEQAIQNKNSGYFTKSTILMPKDVLDTHYEKIKNLVEEEGIEVIGISDRQFLNLITIDMCYEKAVTRENYKFVEEHKTHLTFYNKQKQKYKITKNMNFERISYTYIRYGHHHLHQIQYNPISKS